MSHSRVLARCMPSVVDIAIIRAAIATTYSTWARQATLRPDLKIIIKTGITSLGNMQTVYAPTSITTNIRVSPKRKIYFDTTPHRATNCGSYSSCLMKCRSRFHSLRLALTGGSAKLAWKVCGETTRRGDAGPQ